MITSLFVAVFFAAAAISIALIISVVEEVRCREYLFALQWFCLLMISFPIAMVSGAMLAIGWGWL